MKRRLFMSMSTMGVTMTLVKKSPAKENRPPNVILIMADDVSWECFGCYGAEDYKTPHIDALADKGIRFANCYSTPICTPSRVKIMTGKYNFRNYSHFGYLDPKEKTFGHLMQEAGYKTAIAGKWQLNGLYHKAEDCLDNKRPFKAGFDEYCLWQVTTGKKSKKGSKGGERYWSPPLEQNGKFITKEENEGKYGPDIMSDFLCDFMEKNKNQPFFVYYPMVLVHDPFVPTPDTIGLAPRTQQSNKQTKDKGKDKENFVAMVNYMDKIIDKIVKKVDSIGQLDNTIILFTADNGTYSRITSRWNGQEIRGGKGSMKDMGTHVPFVAFWKGHTPKGVVFDDLIDFTDFYATLAEASGSKLGKIDPIDGRSFFPRLKDEKGNPREWVFCHYQPYWGGKNIGQFARNQTYKLYRDGRFYHVPKDLLEENNINLNNAGELTVKAHKKLNAILDKCPPAPLEKNSGKNSTNRPLYPDWNDISDPND